MARIRKTSTTKTALKQIFWKIGIYVRLSREDGNIVSESVVNQCKIINDELTTFFPDEAYEIVETYIDDGTSGTTDVERASFQRMVQDVKSGRINCIIVKNLSRAFRNSANQGHFLEEFLPLYGVRFISLYQPRMDTYLDSEVVHSLEVSITGFMNEQYAYKTSADVRRTFKNKRENGEFIGAFAPYGYIKDPADKNALLIDEEAAQVVRDIFTWFVTDSMTKMGIAKKLNELGVPNRAAYKRSKGFHYENPHAINNDGKWSACAIARILQNPLYIGVMRQGQQKVISYKVHKRASVPESDWFVVENAVPPIISKELFDAAQALNQRDTRVGTETNQVYMFAGLIRCADCGKAMHRSKSGKYLYYVCRTYQEKGRNLCTKHRINSKDLESAVLAAIQSQIAMVATLSEIIQKINEAPVVKTESIRLNAMLSQRTKELEKAQVVADSLYVDWKSGDITRDQYRRMKVKTDEQIAQLEEAITHIKEEQQTMAAGVTTEDPYLVTFLKHRNVKTLSRGLLTELVDMIYVHENKELEIKFKYQDQFRRITEFIENNQNDLRVIGDKKVS